MTLLSFTSALTNASSIVLWPFSECFSLLLFWRGETDELLSLLEQERADGTATVRRRKNFAEFCFWGWKDLREGKKYMSIVSVIWLSLCGSGTQRSCGPQLWLQLVKGLGVNLWAKPEGSTVGRWDQDASTDVPAISCYPHVPADEMHLCELPCSPQRCGCSQALLRAKAGPCTRSKCFAFPGTLILFSNCKGSPGD